MAGGAALLAQNLSRRPTEDLDLFTRPGASTVDEACAQFAPTLEARGWQVETVRHYATFCRLLIHSSEDLLVDLALESAPVIPAQMTVAGPSFTPEELAGRKLVALFDRAAARDFVDIYALSRRFDKQQMIERAFEVDAGFDTGVLAEMLAMIDRYSEEDLALGDVDVASVRLFFTQWLGELRR